MQDCTEHDILTVTTTVGTLEDAQALAGKLLERRLAACVQLDEVAASLYRWEGRVCSDPEVRLSIKTVPEVRDVLLAFLEQQHPYELPQFIASVQAGSPRYAAWVREETRASA